MSIANKERKEHREKKKEHDAWQKGIVFIRGLNMFASSRITKEQVLRLCRDAENRNIKILGAVKTDNIIFKKRNIHYATVGSAIEKILSRHFDKKVHATARSMSTINRCNKYIMTVR